ncbi:hypothetical protein KIH86_27480, partial [Paenibacillus sp. HN-1]|uniref:hypothetical protein n=1 Tax=Paenibacillus sinensis TaxID=2834413 RepID=UPI001CA9D552
GDIINIYLFHLTLPFAGEKGKARSLNADSSQYVIGRVVFRKELMFSSILLNSHAEDMRRKSEVKAGQKLSYPKLSFARGKGESAGRTLEKICYCRLFKINKRI